MFDIPQWSMIDNPYSYRYNGSNTVLITVGDSWTYGDSLGQTKVRNGVDDTQYRLTWVYGNILSNLMRVNWINLALPGGSNEWMLNSLETLLPTVAEEKVVCVITLTESGRHEELQLIDRSLPTQQLVLTHILAHTYNRIEQLKQKYPQHKFIVGHNFTDGALGITDLLEFSWLETMLERKVQYNTHIVVSDHIAQMNYEKRFIDVLDVMERAEARVNLLDQCKYCNKEDTRHPNEVGHSLWALYLDGVINGTINSNF
jgi:DNA polymerase III psi subunit